MNALSPVCGRSRCDVRAPLKQAKSEGVVVHFDWVGEDGVTISGDVSRGDAGLVITRAELHAPVPTGLTHRVLRSAPLGEILKAVRAHVALEEARRRGTRAIFGEEPAPGLFAEGDARIPKTAGRTLMTDELLRSVAIAYVQETAPGKDRQAIGRLAERFDRPEGTVRTWVARARKDGWLAPGAKGRMGADPGPRLLGAVSPMGVHCRPGCRETIRDNWSTWEDVVMTDTTGLRLREGDQPLPTSNGLPVIQDLVIADIQERRRLGVARYGTPLQPFNGRDALRDAYEEAVDLAMYLRQAMFEAGPGGEPPEQHGGAGPRLVVSERGVAEARFRRRLAEADAAGSDDEGALGATQIAASREDVRELLADLDAARGFTDRFAGERDRAQRECAELGRAARESVGVLTGRLGTLTGAVRAYLTADAYGEEAALTALVGALEAVDGEPDPGDGDLPGFVTLGLHREVWLKACAVLARDCDPVLVNAAAMICAALADARPEVVDG